MEWLANNFTTLVEFVERSLLKKVRQEFSNLFSKWFIFSAVGLRLFLAGIKQIVDPAFTAKEIFHLDNFGWQM